MDLPRYGLGEGFQAKVLALCLKDPGFLPTHHDLVRPEYFEKVELSIISRAVTDYFRKHSVVPTAEAVMAMVHEYARDFGGISAQETLANLASYVSHLYAMELSDAPFIIERMVHFGQRQALKQAMDQAVNIISSTSDDDLSKIRQLFDDALRVGSCRNAGTDFVSIAADLPKLLLEDPIYGIKNKVPTGLRVLDGRLMGGMGAGEVVVIAGPPGRGKSTFMINMGKHAAYYFKSVGIDKSVVYITLEGGMKELDISAKFGSCITGVPINEIVAGSAAYSERIQQQLTHLGLRSIQIKYFSPATVGVEDLRWFIANLCNGGPPPGIIFVDYADKLKGMEEDRYRDAGRIYDGLTGLGDRFSCPVVTGSQINRTWAEEELIDTRGLAESWLKVANSDVVLTLNQTKTEHVDKKIRIFQAKVRKGEDFGVIYCHWRGDTASIWEMTELEVRNYIEEKAKEKKGSKVA